MLALTLALVATALPNALPQQAAANVKPHVLIITGHVGDSATYEKELLENGKRIADGIRTKYNVPDSMITFLGENPKLDPMIKDSSTKVNIEKAFATITKRAKPGDVVFVMLIGHGSSQDQSSSKFMIPGPDMIAADFAKLLAPLSKEMVIFVNSTSASGNFIKELAGKDRIILTSTSSTMERDYAKFAKHFTAAVTADEADADKDGRVSVLEAFDYTRRKVEGEYKSKQELQSEHATLDDDGDGTGVPTPELTATDGRLAARTFLTGVMPEDPRLTELLNQYATLRTKIEGFVANRGDMEGAAYGQELQGMFVDLAVLSLKARLGGGGKP